MGKCDNLLGKSVFSIFKYIKVKSLGPYINYFNFWDFSSIKSLVGDLKLIFPNIFVSAQQNMDHIMLLPGIIITPIYHYY